MRTPQMQWEIKQWTEENEPTGRACGYPQCCIDEFCAQPPVLLKKTGLNNSDRLRFEAAHIDGKYTGFIPCVNHARQVLLGETTLQSLINGRDPALPPFPQFGFYQK